MQGLIAIFTATITVTDIDKVTATGGAHPGFPKWSGQHITQRHDAVPRRLAALLLDYPASTKHK